MSNLIQGQKQVKTNHPNKVHAGIFDNDKNQKGTILNEVQNSFFSNPDTNLGYNLSKLPVFSKVLSPLTVSKPGNRLEEEADQIADKAMNSKKKTVQESPGQQINDPASQTNSYGEPHMLRRENQSHLKPISFSSGNNIFSSPGQPLDKPARKFMESRFGHDFSGIKIHTDSKAQDSAQSLHAQAFTVGQNIAFSQNQYSPKTESGLKLLAHELVHTLQTEAGSPPGLIQRRRVPGSTELAAAAPPTSSGMNQIRAGLARVLSRAWGGLDAAKQAAVLKATASLGFTWTTEAGLMILLSSALRPKLLAFAQAIRTAAPEAELGDPLLIDTGARPATPDAKNITSLVSGADTIFGILAGASHDADITQIFGAPNLAAAKTKYANARTRMNHLHSVNKIVTDRSGYNAEVSLGGLSNSSQIALHPSIIDNPTEKESIITLIHESMHAGNSGLRDFGYIGSPSFTALAATVKLNNAAHFEIVPRRILGAAHAFSGQTFIPAGTTVGGVAAAALTPRETAIHDASETYRAAWAVGLNLHKLFVRVFKAPSEWNALDLSTQFGGAAAGSHFADALPFWSKVEMLTIHSRMGSINPAGSISARPVTQIDIALSEGLTRKLIQGMRAIPANSAAAQTLETTKASAAERTAAAGSIAAERDLLIRLVIRASLGSMTGDENRDAKVVARMALASSTGNFSDMLGVRPPSAFP